MKGVKVKRLNGSYSTHKLLDCVAVVLGILTVLLIALSRNLVGSGQVLKGSGMFAPILLIVLVVVLIGVYLKISEN